MADRETAKEDLEMNPGVETPRISSVTKVALGLAFVVSVACAVAVPLVLSRGSDETSDELEPPDANSKSNDQDETAGGDDHGAISLQLAPSAGCNRYEHLCSKRLDEVTFACLHNAYATQRQGFNKFFSNQVEPLSNGLVAGARALMLDVHMVDAETILLCHFDCSVGSSNVLQTLDVIAEFLELNPREIVFLLWETQVKTEEAEIETLKQLLTDTAQASRLAPFLTVHGADEAWPTLEQMIANNQRLVWLTDRQEGTLAAWDLHMWEVVVDTPYSNSVKADLEAPCSFLRGGAQNPFFLINHFLSPPDQRLADTINYNPFLLERATRCSRELNKHPNFIAVDYFSSSDIFEVVTALNAQNSSNITNVGAA